ncbi:hypothetical protein F4802DRAFT_583836 [Xylaria palmicola]|nr:hypothetical protein F4802DRAFT_583836 [Xylaria palmicola]
MPLSPLLHLRNAVSSKGKLIEPEHLPRPRESGENFLRVLSDPADANIDVIAVHGLNPLNKQFHAESTWTSNGNLWLRDFLPKRVPRARICLFGYNSNVAFGSSAAGVREQGENLLNHLDQARAENPSRPLIFICHSLGGLIVKRALVHAKADVAYEKIWASTFGLVFFATPQQGGNNAGLGDAVAGIARCVLGNPSNTFMTALKSSSTFLSIITDDFRQLLEDFQIISFYETRPLGPLGIVVDPKSALLGLPGTRERQIPLDADHRGICKFDSNEDSRYKQVEDNIAQMINNATFPAANYRRSEEERPLDIENACRITGQANAATQAGHTNQTTIVGEKNKSDQFGNRNRCDIDGMGNTAMQASLDTGGIVLLWLKLIMDRYIIGGGDTSQT